MKDARERKSIKRLASLLIFAAGLFLFTACGGPETAPPYLGTYMDADGGRIVVDETGVTVNGATHAYTATESGGVWTLAAGTETLYVFDGGAVLCADAAPIDTGGLGVRSGDFAAVFTMGSQTITSAPIRPSRKIFPSPRSLRPCPLRSPIPPVPAAPFRARPGRP